MRRLGPVLAVLLVSLVTATPAAADAGQPDPGFGDGGTVAVDEIVNAFDLAASDDGGVLLLGVRIEDARSTAHVVRLRPDGTVDRSYGTDGAAAVAPGQAVYDTRDVLATTDGAAYVSYVVADRAHLTRIDADGDIDPAFGSPEVPTAGELTMEPDGDLLIADGSTVARVTADGRRDTGFGDDGVLRHRSNIGAVAVQPGGKLVATGIQPHNGLVEHLILRFNADGTTDTSFGFGGGIVASAFAPQPRETYGPLTDIAVLPDGRIAHPVGLFSRDGARLTMVAPGHPHDGLVIGVGGGRAFASDGHEVTRLHDDGTADPTYGDCGLARSHVAVGVLATHIAPDGTVYLLNIENGVALVTRIQPGGGPVNPVPPMRNVALVTDTGALRNSDLGCFAGHLVDVALNRSIVGMTMTPSGEGYWMVASDGGTFSFGDARFFGSTGAMPLNQPIVGVASTPSGRGYYLVAADGGVFTFGDAVFRGSTGDRRLNQPVVGLEVTPSGNGYWLVASDGGVFTFGDAAFEGSTGGIRLNQPIVGMDAAPSGSGYWLVAADGGVFAFSVAFLGSGAAEPGIGASAIRTSPTGNGYVLIPRSLAAFDVRRFGDAQLRHPNAGSALHSISGTRFVGGDVR